MNNEFSQFNFVSEGELPIKKVKFATYTAPTELIEEATLAGSHPDPFEIPNPKKYEKSTYGPTKKLRVLSPPRHDAFADPEKSPEPEHTGYNTILIAQKLENERHDVEIKIKKLLREQEQEKEKRVNNTYVKPVKSQKQSQFQSEASTDDNTASEWEKDEPNMKSYLYAKSGTKSTRGDTMAMETPTPNKWNHLSSAGFAETPTPRRGKSRWDEKAPAMIGAETPTMYGGSTPGSAMGQTLEMMTPGRIQEIVREKTLDEKNKPWTEQELDQFLPSDGFEHFSLARPY